MGELIQIDGSEHHWFEDRGPRCTLLVFTDRYNAKFAKVPRRADNLHRPINIEPDRLRDVFALQNERLVGAQLAFSYECKQIILTENEITRGLPGKYVDTFAFPDGRFEVRWKGVSIPLLNLRQGSARDPRGDHRGQASQCGSGTH